MVKTESPALSRTSSDQKSNTPLSRCEKHFIHKFSSPRLRDSRGSRSTSDRSHYKPPAGQAADDKLGSRVGREKLLKVTAYWVLLAYVTLSLTCLSPDQPLDTVEARSGYGSGFAVEHGPLHHQSAWQKLVTLLQPAVDLSDLSSDINQLPYQPTNYVHNNT